MYHILPAQFEHIPWLRLLYTRWMAESPYDYPIVNTEEVDNFVLAIAQHLNNNPLFCCLVAVVGKKIIGFFGGEITQRAIGKPHILGTAHWLYVVPKHRGKGVSRLLIASALQFALKHNIDTIEVTEQIEQAGNWERRGFKPFHIRYYLTIPEIAARLQPPAPPPPPGDSSDGVQLSLPFSVAS